MLRAVMEKRDKIFPAYHLEMQAAKVGAILMLSTQMRKLMLREIE